MIIVNFLHPLRTELNLGLDAKEKKNLKLNPMNVFELLFPTNIKIHQQLSEQNW